MKGECKLNNSIGTRIISGMLAVLMAFSTMSNTALTVFATGSDTVAESTVIDDLSTQNSATTKESVNSDNSAVNSDVTSQETGNVDAATNPETTPEPVTPVPSALPEATKEFFEMVLQY